MITGRYSIALPPLTEEEVLNRMSSDAVAAIIPTRTIHEIIEELSRTDPEVLVPTPAQIKSDAALIDAAFSKDKA